MTGSIIEGDWLSVPDEWLIAIGEISIILRCPPVWYFSENDKAVMWQSCNDLPEGFREKEWTVVLYIDEKWEMTIDVCEHEKLDTDVFHKLIGWAAVRKIPTTWDR